MRRALAMLRTRAPRIVLDEVPRTARRGSVNTRESVSAVAAEYRRSAAIERDRNQDNGYYEENRWVHDVAPRCIFVERA